MRIAKIFDRIGTANAAFSVSTWSFGVICGSFRLSSVSNTHRALYPTPFFAPHSYPAPRSALSKARIAGMMMMMM